MKYILSVLLVAALVALKAHTPAQINNSVAIAEPQTVQAQLTSKQDEASPQPPKATEPETQQTVKTVVQHKGCEAYKHLIAQYDWDLQVATAVMRAESGCNPTATNKANRNGSVDRGLFQVNSVHKAKVGNLDDLYDPATNIRIAYRVYLGSGWKAWSVYNSGAYKRFL